MVDALALVQHMRLRALHHAPQHHCVATEHAASVATATLSTGNWGDALYMGAGAAAPKKEKTPVKLRF